MQRAGDRPELRSAGRRSALWSTAPTARARRGPCASGAPLSVQANTSAASVRPVGAVVRSGRAAGLLLDLLLARARQADRRVGTAERTSATSRCPTTGVQPDAVRARWAWMRPEATGTRCER